MQIGALIALLRGVTLPFLASISAVFEASVDKMTPGSGGYQRTNTPYTNWPATCSQTKFSATLTSFVMLTVDLRART
jgi:hypothetical protein